MRLVSLLLSLAFALISTGNCFAQATIVGFGVGKKADYFQNSNATPVSQAIIGDLGGPYHFSADLSGTNLNLLRPAPQVRTPLSILYSLSGDSTDVGYIANFATKSELDTAFPNGTYSFSGGTFSLPLSLGATDSFPTAIPCVTNSTWNGAGKLVVNPLLDYTLNFSSFTDYLKGAGGLVDISVYTVMDNAVAGLLISNQSTAIAGTVSEPMLTSHKIPANFLQANRTYYVELSFVRIVNIDASSPSRLGLASFVNTTAFLVTTEPADVLPHFTWAPSNQTATVGSQILIISHFEGYPIPTCQWFKNGVPIAGATNSTLQIGNAQFSDSGHYTETLTNRAGVVTSNDVTVTVNPKPLPLITVQPMSASVNPGTHVIFSVGIEGEYPMVFQWYLNDQPIPGATSTSLDIPVAGIPDAGRYVFKATNAGGTVSSNAAVLSFTAQVGVCRVDAGYNSSFFVKSDGSLWGTGAMPSPIVGFSPTATFIKYYPVKIADDVATVAAGSTHCLFIKKDGSLWGFGNNYNGQLGDGTTIYRKEPIQIDTNVVAAAGGHENSLYIKADGTLWAMGYNQSGELGIGNYFQPQLSPVQVDSGVVSVSAGYQQNLFVKWDGSLWATGECYFGQPDFGYVQGFERPIKIAEGVRIAFAQGIDSYCIKLDSTFWNLGPFSLSPNPPNSNQWELVDTNIATADCGNAYMLWKMNDGSLWLPSTQTRSVQVVIAEGVAFAAAGGAHLLFAMNNGSLWGKGGDNYGALGDGGAGTEKTSPVLIANGVLTLPTSPEDVIAVPVAPSPAVRLNWRPTIAATSYEVWRGTTNDLSLASRIADKVENAIFYDLTAQNGVTYSYWVRAVNPAGASGFSPFIAPPSDAVITITVE